MRGFLETYKPVTGLGMTSLVLGTIGLMIAFFPVLGIPISSFGLLCGILGGIAGLFLSTLGLRWSLAGIAMSSLALLINVALTYAPEGYIPGRNPPKPWEPPPERPYVPPPAVIERFVPPR